MGEWVSHGGKNKEREEKERVVLRACNESGMFNLEIDCAQNRSSVDPRCACRYVGDSFA